MNFPIESTSTKVKETLQAAVTTNFDKSPKKNNKNLRIPWPSGGRQKADLFVVVPTKKLGGGLDPISDSLIKMAVPDPATVSKGEKQVKPYYHK